MHVRGLLYYHFSFLGVGFHCSDYTIMHIELLVDFSVHIFIFVVDSGDVSKKLV